VEQKTARQRRRLASLTDQRTKLLHAYYEDAIPLDVLQREQNRLTGQITNAEAQLSTAQRSCADDEKTLKKALELLANCHDAYTKAPSHLRRQWNQALFTRLLVHDQNIHDTEPVIS
jgi:flagellar capping protein FliD